MDEAATLGMLTSEKAQPHHRIWQNTLLVCGKVPLFFSFLFSLQCHLSKLWDTRGLTRVTNHHLHHMVDVNIVTITTIITINITTIIIIITRPQTPFHGSDGAPTDILEKVLIFRDSHCMGP